MPRYNVTLTQEERNELKGMINKGGKGHRIRHAQVLLKLDKIPENEDWTYEKIQDAHEPSHANIAGIAKRHVYDGLEAALGRKKRENYPRKVTGDIEAVIVLIVCSNPPEGRSRRTMKLITKRLIDTLRALKTLATRAARKRKFSSV